MWTSFRGAGTVIGDPKAPGHVQETRGTDLEESTMLRSREKITCAKSAAETPGWQGARNEHTRRYVSDERRSQPGWIGRAPAKVIFERRLNDRSRCSYVLAEWDRFTVLVVPGCRMVPA